MVHFSLVGSVPPEHQFPQDYAQQAINLLAKGDNEYCWSGWNYDIAKGKLESLRSGDFYLYLNYSGTSAIKYRMTCVEVITKYPKHDKGRIIQIDQDYYYSNPKHQIKHWFKVIECIPIYLCVIKGKCDQLRQISNDNPVSTQATQNHFAYVKKL